MDEEEMKEEGERERKMRRRGRTWRRKRMGKIEEHYSSDCTVVPNRIYIYVCVCCEGEAASRGEGNKLMSNTLHKLMSNTLH